MGNDSNNERVAVFTRNHPQHLERAARMTAGDAVVFRSRVRWASAEEAVEKQGRVEVYIAPMDGANEVQYVASLVRVFLDPSATDPEVADYLDANPAANPGEEVWENTGVPAQTLYVLRSCRRLPLAVPVSDLIKRDGEPISPDYAYSYAIVRELPASRLERPSRA